MLEIGKTYVLFVPPGWLLGGTVRAVEESHVVLDDVVFLQSVSSGFDMVGGVANAATPAELKAVVSQSWGWPDGTRIAGASVSLAAPCRISLRSLARAAAGATIEEV